MAIKLLDNNVVELKVDQFNDVTILPIEPFPSVEMIKGIRFGAFHNDGSFASELFPFKEFYPMQVLKNYSKPQTINHLPIKAIYGGMLIQHFGHFIIDTLSRFWYINSLKEDLPIVLNVFDIFENLDGNGCELRSFQKQYFDFVGVDTNRFIFVNQPVCVESLIVPSKGFVGQLYSNPEYFDLISCKAEIKKKTKKVWLSRSKVSSWDPVEHVNILEVEDILRQHGWLIVYPEELELSEQLDLFREARVVSGLEGSAFHVLAIVDQLPDLVVMFPRTLLTICQNDLTLGRVRNINQHVVHLNYEKINNSGKKLRIVDPYEPLNILIGLEATL